MVAGNGYQPATKVSLNATFQNLFSKKFNSWENMYCERNFHVCKKILKQNSGENLMGNFAKIAHDWEASESWEAGNQKE